MDEVTLPKTQSQPQPSAGEKRKSLSKMLDLGNLPNCQGNKKAKHGSSKPGVVKSSSIIPPAFQQPSIQIHDLDSSIPVVVTLSKPIVTTSSQPSRRIPMNLLKNEDLAWERFQKAMTDEDMAVCYDMSLKEFEHSAVYDIFKVCFHYFVFISSYYISHLLSNQLQSIAYVGYVKVHSSV